MTKEIFIGGVFCGHPVAQDLYAEKEGDGRFLVRERCGTDSTRRLGMVFVGAPHSGAKRYLAVTMSGQALGKARSLRGAVSLLHTHRPAKPVTEDKQAITRASR